MGRMLFSRAQQAKLSLEALDKPLIAQNVQRASQGCDLALFCVPAPVLCEALSCVCPYLPSTCIVADITSVKVLPMTWMESQWAGNVVGTHPLFGPNPDPSLPLSVAITAGTRTQPEALATTEAFIHALGFTSFRCTPEQHDKAMAKIQNLNFITNLAYFALLAKHDDLLPFLTPSFHRRLKAAQKMLTEDAAMFSALFESNPMSQEVVRTYHRILQIAASGDIEILCKPALWWFEDKSGVQKP